MQTDSIALALRPRSRWEGCDLGVRLLQSSMTSVFSTWAPVAAPVLLVCLLTDRMAGWLPFLSIWLSKPWLDRTILYSLSRALFGRRTTPRDLWRARREVWRVRIAGLALQRLSASRSFRQPIVQLEGLSGAELADRIRRLTQRHRGVARAMTVAFASAEFALFASILSLRMWLSPHSAEVEWSWLGSLDAAPGLLAPLAYAAAVGFLEPFYVAAGFGMYVNRRVELEAWDIEQEFRRAFGA